MVAAGSITVAVRVRPPTAWETARLPEAHYETTVRGDGTFSTPAKVVNTAPLRDIVQIVDDRIITFDPDEKDRARAFMERGFLPPGTKRYKDKRFMFDRVFRHDATQQQVYETTVQPLLKGILDGYNATVFAYGATGCGKTHTISGSESDPGIIYSTMADLFQRIDERREEWDVEVMVTFLEIYNEEIRDLLAESGSAAPRGGLSIREDKTVKVVGLAELKPRTADEVKEIVLLGNTRRTQSPTHANETSSRSHAVLQVHITQSPRTASITEQRLAATLSIIDLAGSERAAATTNMGQRMVEGANINKSLLALGNCINALCESGGAVRHIPYRNSKLTRLLKFSLGGNCKTVMIVCIAPTSNHFDDTHNTLVYAERATRIRTKVVTRNVLNVDRHVGQYVEAINRLNAEVAELKEKLAGKRDAENEIVKRKKAEVAAEVERSKNDMKSRFEHTKASILDGAICTAKLSVAKSKLGVIRARLAELSSSISPLSADLEAERALLEALCQPEERVIRPDSALSLQVQRSSNSSAIFEATMKAVAERRSEKLDDMSMDNIRLDAMRNKADMEAAKANGEREAMREAVEDLARVVVGLVGMLGRCTVAVGGAASALELPRGEGDTELEDRARATSTLLRSVKEGNDAMFQRLVGHSTAGYTINNLSSAKASLADAYKSCGVFTRRISSGPAVLQTSAANNSRRLSAAVASPPRRGHRSPRKSLRSSLSQPYRRVVSDKEKKGIKSVQWKDEAGRGTLDDGGPRGSSSSSQPPSFTSSSPTYRQGEGVDKTMPSITTSSSVASISARLRSSGSSPSLMAGSESEWEDENEKTEDSFTLRVLGNSSREGGQSFSLASSAPLSAPASRKRSKPNHLDPSFLKSRARGSTLDSLQETDELGSPTRSSRRQQQYPLTDMNLNHLSTTSSETSISDNTLETRGSSSGSLTRRGPSRPNRPSSASTTSSNASTVMGNNRRRSYGPVRIEKGRRRSSMIPQLSPNALATGATSGESNTLKVPAARRALIASPAKKAKRLSLMRAANVVIAGSSSIGSRRLTGSEDPNTSLVESRPSSRAAWK
ncbi:P-loop containing nucleoside triphosphate hydrolase protein [Amanita rubescens]|nr:P-loop containing nucleoside triphosphate hydrolase protein [Amanita rubescens]